MDEQFPRFNVVAQWTSGRGIFIVEAVEVAEDPDDLPDGGKLAVRVQLLDREGNTRQGFALQVKDMEELCHFAEMAFGALIDRLGGRRLPAVSLWGKRYVVDEDLKEVRNIDDPNDRFELRIVE